MRTATRVACSPSVAGVADPGRRRHRVRSGVSDPGCKDVLRAIGAGLFLFVATLLPAQPKEELIYPRGTAPAGAPATPVESRSQASSLILATAVLAAVGGWWFWQKRRSSLGGAGAGAPRLVIAESRSLGSRQYLVVADYDGRKFLLGVCPGSIQMLTPLDGEKAKES